MVLYLFQSMVKLALSADWKLCATEAGGVLVDFKKYIFIKG